MIAKGEEYRKFSQSENGYARPSKKSCAISQVTNKPIMHNATK